MVTESDVNELVDKVEKVTKKKGNGFISRCGFEHLHNESHLLRRAFVLYG